MYLIFYKTSDVFAVEEIFRETQTNVEVVPTPVQDKAYCGVCLKVSFKEWEKEKARLDLFEYKTLE